MTNQTEVAADQMAPIITFLSRRLPSFAQTSIDLLKTDPEAPAAAFMTGDAFPNGGWLRGDQQRHRVVVYIPTLRRPYPVRQRNPAGHGCCPVVDLRGWQEELLLVLAHELQHVRQYESARCAAEVVEDADDRYEVEAEQTAVRMVGEWRAAECAVRPRVVGGSPSVRGVG